MFTEPFSLAVERPARGRFGEGSHRSRQADIEIVRESFERRGHCRRADPAVRAGGRPTRGEACLLPRCYELGKAFRACREMRCAMIHCDLGIARIGAAGREAAADSAGLVKTCRPGTRVRPPPGPGHAP